MEEDRFPIRLIENQVKEMDEKMKKYPQPESIPVTSREYLNQELTHSPIWCSVDLRDGNQALPMPMNPEKKLQYFKLLCQIGFKEIEVSFPSASQDDFDFVRGLAGGSGTGNTPPLCSHQ